VLELTHFALHSKLHTSFYLFKKSSVFLNLKFHSNVHKHLTASAHILCECEALASLRHAYLGSLFLEPKDIQSISLGAIWSFSKASGLPWLDMGHKGPALRPRCIGDVRSQTLDTLILILKHLVVNYILNHLNSTSVFTLCFHKINFFINFLQLLGTYAKLRKETVSSVMLLSPSVCLQRTRLPLDRFLWDFITQAPVKIRWENSSND
jgi:hypothetical protein